MDRELSIRIAGNLFLSHGYDNVSLQNIGAKTGCSLEALCVAFDSKENIFALAISQFCSEVLSPLNLLSVVYSDAGLYPVEQATYTLGRGLLETILSDRLLELHRLMITEAKRFTHLAKAWFDAGPDRANYALADFSHITWSLASLRAKIPAWQPPSFWTFL